MLGSNVASHDRARWAIGLAAGAVLLGHGITYGLVHPDGHERADILASTGHAYLHLLEGPGLALALTSVVVAMFIGTGLVGAAPDRGTLFRRLVTFQLAAFVAMEVAERVASGATDVGAPDVGVVLVGIVVQVTLARVGTWILGTVGDAGERLAGSCRRGTVALTRHVTISIALPADPFPVSLASVGPPPGRAPPSSHR